ncbi:hypothetical protein PR202_ga07669 [Eleusine coracana subsp. coracana]|uniref:Transcription repressor n=1 Tax=Eleusine coracana subsp. coracana TaxID=191504 RepID=A0AAV5BZA6_ELECO|nr:hypothetical protein PR202_ga07669 [Eleusine coracana subsp. coracana]
MLRRRGGAGGGLRIKRKKARGFMCGGCGGSKAVSISDGSDKQSPTATPPTAAASSTPTTTMSFTSTTTTKKGTRRAVKNKTAVDGPSSFSDTTASDAHSSSVDESTPSLSALLRQLRDLERSVRFLHSAAAPESGAAADNYSNIGVGGGGRRHRRTVSDGSGSGRVEESVAVVKESADPLGDFRRSMLQMIVEKEIMGDEELRELLLRFLSLNSPQHHHLIIRAFAEIWEELFAGYARPPDFLASSQRHHHTKKHQNVRA